MNKFKNDNNSINILCNVHILDEGIDIPECDSIFLTHPNNNPINIIQRISRANRLDNSNVNKVAKIFIWYKDELKLEQIMKNITKIINIKYGTESNEFINTNIKIENVIDNYKIKNFIKNNLLINEDFFEKYKINTIIDNNNIIWFNAKQICIALEYKQPKKAIINHVKQIDKIQLKNINISFKIRGQPDSIYINEKGLFVLLITSKHAKLKNIINI